MAPRLRPLLTPPNDGTQKENKLDLRVALKTVAGHERHRADELPKAGFAQGEDLPIATWSQVCPRE